MSDFLCALQENPKPRTDELHLRLCEFGITLWTEVSGALEVNGIMPILPPAPSPHFFYGVDAARTVAFSEERGFCNDIFLADQCVGLALTVSGWSVLRLDLENQQVLVLTPSATYHRKLLDTITRLLLGRCKDAMEQIANEFFLLANVNRLAAEYTEALNRAALAKVQRDNQQHANQARTKARLAWDDLILPQSIKDDLETYCQVLRKHEYYYSQGITVPKGLLFHGPSGVGKTQTARILSREAGFAFVSLSTADCKVGYIGHAAAKIKEIFAEARKKAPCLIFIDELDAVCPPRGCYLDCISQEVTAQLLQEMDGLHSDGQAIFVFAATNRLDMVDTAVLDRFTEHVEIALPGPEERMKLIALFVGKIPFAESDSASGIEILARLALVTEGKSGRDLKNLVAKATMRAIKRSAREGDEKPVILEESDFALLRSVTIAPSRSLPMLNGD
jgi:AAA+ superfamily predicted ATPase